MKLSPIIFFTIIVNHTTVSSADTKTGVIGIIKDDIRDPNKREVEWTAQHGSGIQVIYEGEDLDNVRKELLERDPVQEFKCEGERRCAYAATLFSPGIAQSKAIYLPDVTYTFWKCGGGSKDGCTCGITKIVTVPANELVAMEFGEYLSENGCNAKCMRGKNDKCWVCDSDTYNGGGGMFYTTYSCKHKADITPDMLNAKGTKSKDCFKVGVCPVIELLPYIIKYPPSF